MKINFNPVSFAANVPVSQNYSPEMSSTMMAIELDNEHAAKAKNDIELFNFRMQDDNWKKDVVGDFVQVRMGNCIDGAVYTIDSSGKTVMSSGWSNPKVITDSNEALGKYVREMKDYYNKKTNIPFGSGAETAQPYTMSTDLLEAFKSNFMTPAKDINETLVPPVANDLKDTAKTAAENISAPTDTQPSTSADNTDFATEEQKAEEYKNHLHDDRWEKLYSKEDDTIYLKQKNLFDGLEYVITSDGTVKETGLNIEPSVILKDDEESKKLFETTNKTPAAARQEKPSLFKRVKEGFANVWKFFASFGQMAVSTAKGITYGAATAIGMLAGFWAFGALPKSLTKEGPKITQIIKHPLKHIGVPGKVLAAVGSAGVLAYQLIVGKMAANQKTAVIDHKLNTGHRYI